MSVKIRLTRMGKKKQPFYRIVVTDERRPRDGRYIDQVGYYNPKKENEIKIDFNKVDEWIKRGAEVTEIVKNILKKAKKLNKEENNGKDIS